MDDSPAATPSGYASPRHFGQETCSSPGPKHNPDLCWPPPAPWAQQKLAAANAAVSISRRGSTLGTVTEEDTLIGTQAEPVETQKSDTGTPTNATDKAVPSATNTEQGDAAVPAAAVQPAASRCSGAGPSPLSQPPTHLRDVHINPQQHTSTHSQSPLASPRHSGAGGTSTLRAPALSATTFAAGFSSLRQRSPFDKATSPTGASQQGQQQVRAGSSLEPGVELTVQGKALRRRSSDNSSHEQESFADGRVSSGSIELGGDSSTQLIREGVCRSDEHVD